MMAKRALIIILAVFAVQTMIGTYALTPLNGVVLLYASYILARSK